MRIRVGFRRGVLSNSRVPRPMDSRRKVFTGIFLLASMCAGAATRAQEPEDIDLSAKQRILPTIGPGLRAVRQGADGQLYVLASPSPGLVVVDTKGKQLLSINEMPAAAAVVSAMLDRSTAAGGRSACQGCLWAASPPKCRSNCHAAPDLPNPSDI